MPDPMRPNNKPLRLWLVVQRPDGAVAWVEADRLRTAGPHLELVVDVVFLRRARAVVERRLVAQRVIVCDPSTAWCGGDLTAGEVAGGNNLRQRRGHQALGGVASQLGQRTGETGRGSSGGQRIRCLRCRRLPRLQRVHRCVPRAVLRLPIRGLELDLDDVVAGLGGVIRDHDRGGWSA